MKGKNYLSRRGAHMVRKWTQAVSQSTSRTGAGTGPGAGIPTGASGSSSAYSNSLLLLAITLVGQLQDQEHRWQPVRASVRSAAKQSGPCAGTKAAVCVSEQHSSSSSALLAAGDCAVAALTCAPVFALDE